MNDKLYCSVMVFQAELFMLETVVEKLGLHSTEGGRQMKTDTSPAKQKQLSER